MVSSIIMDKKKLMNLVAVVGEELKNSVIGTPIIIYKSRISLKRRRMAGQRKLEA